MRSRLTPKNKRKWSLHRIPLPVYIAFAEPGKSIFRLTSGASVRVDGPREHAPQTTCGNVETWVTNAGPKEKSEPGAAVLRGEFQNAHGVPLATRGEREHRERSPSARWRPHRRPGLHQRPEALDTVGREYLCIPASLQGVVTPGTILHQRSDCFFMRPTRRTTASKRPSVPTSLT